MKKVTSLFLGVASLFASGHMYAQDILPDRMSAISNSSLEITTKDDVNRAKNNKPMVVLPDGSLVFTASSSSTGEELYICKNDQISLIKDIVPGAEGSNPQWLTVVGSKIFFTATTSEYGQELWITDGTDAGTMLVKDIYEGATGSELFGLTAFNGKCMFFARDFDSELDPIIDSQLAEEWLWISDGTEDGTQRIADVPTRKGIDGMSGYLVPSGDKVFFIGYDRNFNETLWTTDGTADGTAPIKDIYPVAATSGNFQTEAAAIDWLTNVKNDVNNVRVVFRANTLNDSGTKIGSEIWYSDGTVEGTKWVGVDYNPGETDGVPNNTEFAFPTSYKGKVYFRAKDGVHGCEPGVTDFTPAGTHYICDINYWNSDPACDSWAPEYPFVWNDFLFCQANGSYYYPADSYQDSGYSLWRYNLTEGGVTPNSDNGLIGFQYQSNWTNGKEIYPGNNADEARYFTPCGGRLYFRAQDVGDNHELWVLESVNDTPKKVSDMEGDSRPHSLTTVGNSLYFITTTTKVLYKYSPEPIGTGLENSKMNEAGNISVLKSGNTIQVTAESELAAIEVYDLTGKCLILQSGNKTTADVSELNSGVYIVRVKDVNGMTFATKVVK
ncbi:T9SS type A sorting domain-containing protein [Bacteroides salyersiae]|uniref:T9SS type A sorting domain-containing protein n=1 Tax=Bacteroides salyersiae TaxID=291644 RepID=UPI001C8B0A90|nr:T9SS type A sorting domain-containing protein [Bacteroides salyersiae]